MMFRRAPPLLALTGLGSAALEAIFARVWSSPLDGAVQASGLVAEGVLLAAVLGGLAALLGRWPRLAVGLPLVLWALVWGPEASRLAGFGLWGLVAGVAVGLAAWRSPGLAVGLTLLGALLVPAARGGVAWTAVDGQMRREERPNILLITVDTARADAGLLDGVVDEGWWSFPGAISAAPWTLPAMHSLMLGLPVVAHGGGLPVEGGYSGVVGGAPTLAERLAEAGYRTMALVSNPHLRGFSAGFRYWAHEDDSRAPFLMLDALDRRMARAEGRVSALRHSRDERLVQAALPVLTAGAEPGLQEPIFLWVHLMGPHEYARDPEVNPAGWTPGTRDPALLRQAYAANVAATRERLKRLATAGDDWRIAIVADHGEALGEDGRWGHGQRLDDVELAVPMAMWLGYGGGVVEGPVGTINLGFMMLTAVGLEPGFPGHELRNAAGESVLVSGVRRDAQAAAVRGQDGVYRVTSPGRAGVVEAEDAQTREALRLLGYE